MSTEPAAPAEPGPFDAAPVGPSGKPVTLADTEEDLLVHGRIGYGTRSPWVMAGLLALIVAVLGIAAWLNSQDDGGGEPKVAPDFTLTLFDGTEFRLADHRGQVVVVNFWASWCDPCREEMPALQQTATVAGNDVVFVGVGAKTDKEDEARAFATQYGVTYPIGRDTEGGDRVNGAIQTDYGVFGFPATYIIDPDGNIDAILMTPITDPAALQPYIDAART